MYILHYILNVYRTIIYIHIQKLFFFLLQVSSVWELVGIDVIGPLPETSSGYKYILTATDYLSKWVEAYPLITKSATEVAENLCKIVYHHGCPARILSNQGIEFVNEVNFFFLKSELGTFRK